MASPMLASSRVLDPHKKGHFNLQISERITKHDSTLRDLSSFKFNHKPQQTSESRTTTLASSDDGYTLTLDDRDDDASPEMYTFRGSRRRSKQSYVLIFDPSKQTCKLEPLSASYTFNLKSAPASSKEAAEQYPQLNPRKASQNTQEDPDVLVNENSNGASDSEPDADNPYDYRHFLTQTQTKKNYDSDIQPSSPDFRTGSAVNTPSMPARKPADRITATKANRKLPIPQPKRRKSPDPLVSSKAKQPTPTVRLDRKASTRPNDTAPPKPTRKPAPSKPDPKIKSAEIVHDSDEDSDIESNTGSAILTIENADDEPPTKKPKGALASLGLGQNLGLGNKRGFLKSPSGGPISLHSAATSVEGSPALTPRPARKAADEDVIDFGDFETKSDDEDDEEGGYGREEEEEAEEEEEDRDVEFMDIGPPANRSSGRDQSSGRSHGRASVSGGTAMAAAGEVIEEDEDEDADFAAELMQGLVSQEAEAMRAAFEDESEESEEE